MREMVKMVVAITVLAAVSGGLLSMAQSYTAPKIKAQKIEKEVRPALAQILTDVSNDPVADRFDLAYTPEGSDKTKEATFFVGVKNGKPEIVAFEATGGGYGGALNVLVAVDLATNEMVGVRVTSNKETAGIGSRAKSDPALLADQFTGKPVEQTYKVKADGGQIDQISGATVTSRAVTQAVTRAGDIYKELKPEIVEKAKQFAG